MNKNLIIAVAITLVVAGGVGFFGGMRYQQSKTPVLPTGLSANRPGGNRVFGRGNGTGMGGRAVVGQVISSDDQGITVKLPDGSSKIVFIADNTMINKATAGNKNDLTIGTTVAVFGTSNADGSVTAQNVQINPMMRITASPSPSASPIGK
ncbi:hypothetical protein C5B42_04725 [Candidatus Cerribacteria bacterium 'Amazon FNV 2010 28 9']|uniref:DUF5666 domain-containing protein n=1 Tax=Candidatus Cerribacteria bacterium 'Amazon FNV 2010 28 9' TaxID=2081795 RepID=A0A317JP21_9BACT|nr:MAG: hypothetical protein C5B42_04725 [Candidatus Cerribacteria bacterium 'Amazon FNV 2010 28 9']